jgi:nicotinate-nucleotide pyrophosphorylase (carboxylating)
MKDIRDEIFRDIARRKVHAEIIAAGEGIIVDIGEVASAAETLALEVSYRVEEGFHVRRGDLITRFSGSPKQIAMAEDRLIGLMAKPSGIAMAARRFVERAGAHIQIVSGAWKKIHVSQKEIVRRAIVAGGASVRICSEPFLYIDKNYVKMLGGIAESLAVANRMNGYVNVIQIKGSTGDIRQEACEASENGADIIFIDSGNQRDIEKVSDCLVRNGKRHALKLAFAGNIQLEDMDRLKKLDVDILDIGRAVIDAPLLDMKMEVLDGVS